MKFKALCLSALLATTSAQAQAQTSPLNTFRLSGELFAIAQAETDPLLMISAAKLRKSVALSASDRAPVGGSSGGEIVTWQDMLDTAAALAGDDDLMSGLIEDIRVEMTKGVADGPVYSVVTIGANGTDQYESLPFTGGAYAEVYVEGKGNTDLNLYIYDAQGRLVCSDTDVSDIAYCGWRPATTSGFHVEVRNKGAAENQYALITN